MGKNKRSKAYYIQSAKRQKKGHAALGPGMVGFLCTCNSHERDCVREAYNVLNEFADDLYGKESLEIKASDSETKHDRNNHGEASDNRDDENCKSTPNKNGNGDSNSVSIGDDDDDEEELVDIEAAIKADVKELKESNQQNRKLERRFQQVPSGAKNCIFVKTTINEPLLLSLAIMDNLLLSQKQRTRKLLRMIPVQETCKANPDDIRKTVERLASSYFKENAQTYCVVFKVRNNSTIKKESMVFDLANILQNANSKNSPDLNVPDVVLGVNIIKNVCCLSFLPHYFTKYCKYNLVLIANKNTTHASDDSIKKTEPESTLKNGDNEGVEISTKKDEKLNLTETEGFENVTKTHTENDDGGSAVSRTNKVKEDTKTADKTEEEKND